MTTAENYDPKQKHLYIKGYEQLGLLKKALNSLKKQGFLGPHISVLGKVDQFYHDKNMEVTQNLDVLQTYWENMLTMAPLFGSLHNPEIGTIFSVGTITSIFFNKVDGKTLGMLSVGPYGILRGIGANEKQATHYLRLLTSGSYLLIVRDYDNELKNYRQLLDDKVNL